MAGEAADTAGDGAINNPAVMELNTLNNKYNCLQIIIPLNIKLKILIHPRIVKVLSSASVVYTNLCFRVVGISQVLDPSVGHIWRSGSDNFADSDPG